MERKKERKENYVDAKGFIIIYYITQCQDENLLKMVVPMDIIYFDQFEFC